MSQPERRAASDPAVSPLMKRKQYAICQQRGHQPSGLGYHEFVEWQVCRWCETHYREETSTRLVETNIP